MADEALTNGERTGLEEVARRAITLQSSIKALNLGITVAGVALIASLLALWLGAMRSGEPVYIPVGESGQLVPMLSMATMPESESETASWLSRALLETLDFHWGNLEAALARSTQAHFSDEGGAEFVAALNAAGFLQAVRDGRGYFRLTLKGNPAPGVKGIDNGVAWQRWEMFGTMEIVGGGGRRASDMLITAVVRRAPAWERRGGLVISSVVLEQV